MSVRADSELLVYLMDKGAFIAGGTINFPFSMPPKSPASSIEARDFLERHGSNKGENSSTAFLMGQLQDHPSATMWIIFNRK